MTSSESPSSTSIVIVGLGFFMPIRAARSPSTSVMETSQFSLDSTASCVGAPAGPECTVKAFCPLLGRAALRNSATSPTVSLSPVPSAGYVAGSGTLEIPPAVVAKTSLVIFHFLAVSSHFTVTST